MKERISQWLQVIIAIVMLALILVTCIDVVGRYFFNAPLAAAFELTQVLLLVLVFLALPLTTARKEHVEVDLFKSLSPAKLWQWLGLFANLILVAILLFFAWYLYALTENFSQANTRTEVLNLSLAPIVACVALFVVVTAVCALLAWNRGIKQND